MANHSSILIWRIPWTEEPGGLQSITSQKVEHDWSNLACMNTELELQCTFIVKHQQAKWHAHRHHDSSKVNHKHQKVGSGPIPGNPQPILPCNWTEFQLSYFNPWKMMLWKCCTQYASKFGKHSSDHRTGKGQFSFQPQRKAMPKNVQTITLLHSSHTLVK